MELPKGYVSRKKTFIPPLKGVIQDRKWAPPMDVMKPDPTNYAPVVHNCGLAGCRPMRLRLKTVANFIATASAITRGFCQNTAKNNSTSCTSKTVE